MQLLHLISIAMAGSPSFATPGPELLPRERPAAARTCAAVDYRPQLGPPRAMGEDAFCFAYSSSVLLTQRTGRDASALDLATGFYFGAPGKFTTAVNSRILNELGADFLKRLPLETSRPGVDINGKLPTFNHLEGGFEASTLAWVNARGICPDPNLPSDGGSARYAPLFAELLRRARHATSSGGPELEGVSPRFRSTLADRVNAEWLRYARLQCRAQPSPVALLPVDVALAGTSREFLRGRRSGEFGDEDQNQLFEALDYALDHDRVAAIGFDLNTVQGHAGYIDDDGDHSVAIVARRPAGGECQYLVRDSAGDACADFKPAIQTRCEHRQYWLTEREMRRSFYSVTYLR